MKRNLVGSGVLAMAVLGTLGSGATEARAQVPGEIVTYETVSPGTRTVTRGEQVIVRRKLFKTVIKERPVRYVTATPPVVRETRVIQQAPIIEQEVVQPPPVIESRVVQPPPIVETRVVQPPPVYQRRVVPVNPVVRTRYYGPSPY